MSAPVPIEYLRSERPLVVRRRVRLSLIHI